MDVMGNCSSCGGAVALPAAWWGLNSPVPRCQRCGALATEVGPVVPMYPRPRSDPRLVDLATGKTRPLSPQRPEPPDAA